MHRLIIVVLMFCNIQFMAAQKVNKNGMTVEWQYNNERLEITMKSPKIGWVAIGFNESSKLQGTYLIMGHVINKEVVVVEHSTLKPGLYKPITELGDEAQVKIISGTENKNGTALKFSLPVKAKSQFAKNLSKGSTYNLLMAYSLEDDFQHHSIMRTSVSIKL